MKKPQTTILVIEEGALKGRRLLIPTKDLNKDIKYAMVEKGEMLGSTHYAMACLVHETFGDENGCPECNAQSGTLKPIMV